MRNLKKMVAAFAATTMIMSVGSVAFADAVPVPVPVANEDHNAVSLTNYTDIIDSSYQWTVIIIPAAKKSAPSLEASDLLYINQGKLTDGFWTNMSTKGESLADGTYTMRIGGNSPTLDSMNPRYYEADFTVETTPQGVEVQLGDANDDNIVDVSDITPVVDHILGTLLTGKCLVAADSNTDGVVDVSDITPIVNHILGTSALGKTTYVAK